jgi:hypothetical protein
VSIAHSVSFNISSIVYAFLYSLSRHRTTLYEILFVIDLEMNCFLFRIEENQDTHLCLSNLKDLESYCYLLCQGWRVEKENEINGFSCLVMSF